MGFGRQLHTLLVLGCLLLLSAGIVSASSAAPATSATAEGSATLFPAGARGSRANIEWRTSDYALALKRRTILYTYARQGEHVLVGSSAVGVDAGDVLIYNPGVITGTIGAESVPGIQPGVNGFSCRDQRARSGQDVGRIRSRAQELAGPDTVPTSVNAAFAPCSYQAPQDGLYAVIFIGPAGFSTDADLSPTGKIDDDPANFDRRQGSTTAAWAIAVRSDLARLDTNLGRTFGYYFSLFTGANQRPVFSTVFPVTRDGYQYQLDMRGIDPNGWIMFGNTVGFLDGETPLYRNVMAAPNAQNPAQLTELQGGVRVAPPELPIFLSQPSGAALSALSIPHQPVLPEVTRMAFAGTLGGNRTIVGAGGTFSMSARNGGTYEVVISRDGHNFDPNLPENRVLRGVRVGGDQAMQWDGFDNIGRAFPVGTYTARIHNKGGEYHFPLVDAENSLYGGPTYTLLNPDGGECVGEYGCTQGFYDDRGYITSNGTLVGTAENGPLCPPQPGGLMPDPLFSGVNGFDTASSQRAFGQQTGGNPNRVCDPKGGFGDAKGLDIWTYVPSPPINTQLVIVAPTAITLAAFSASQTDNGVLVEWTTGTELNTAGFKVLRSDAPDKRLAASLAAALIPATGSGGMGDTYTFLDSSEGALASTHYYWLVEVETDGTETVYGPVMSLGPGGSRLFLPLVQR